MTPHKLLDHVAEILSREAQNGSGMLLLYYDQEFKVKRINVPAGPGFVFVDLLDSNHIREGLAPSEWMVLSKKLWNIRTVVGKTIKLKPQEDPSGPPDRRTG